MKKGESIPLEKRSCLDCERVRKEFDGQFDLICSAMDIFVDTDGKDGKNCEKYIPTNTFYKKYKNDIKH